MDDTMRVMLSMFLFMAALLVFVGIFALDVFADTNYINVSAGFNYTVNCSATNGTSVISCGNYSNICRVNRTMDSNETLNMTGGPCDLQISCGGVPESRLGGVNFPGFIRITKDNNATVVRWHVDDYNGIPYRDVEWNISDADLVVQERKVDFRCPAEIKTNINYDTCAEFFDTFLKTQDTSVLSVMALSSSSCQKELLKAQAEVMARQGMSQQYELDYIDQVARGDALKEDLQECKTDLLGPDGSCERDKGTLRDEISKYKREYVPLYWEYAAIILLVMFIVLLVLASFGGKE